MKTITVHAAKTQLSKLIAAACAGEEVIIARRGEPVVRLVRVDSRKPQRKFGAMKGRAQLTEAFFEPLPQDELKAWE